MAVRESDYPSAGLVFSVCAGRSRRTPIRDDASPPRMTASSLRCPGCGAPAAPDAAACTYCGSALATVNCPACFAPNFVGSRFCVRCGAAVVRAADEDAAPLPCPRCNETMAALRLGETNVRECGACGGLWLDAATLQALCDAREAHAGITSALAARRPTATAPDTVRYVPCPSCRKLMNRVNFARSSGVIMDVCKPHGVWLDRGELERVIGFVEAGGMTIAREHERMRLAEEERRLRAAQAELSAQRVAGDTAFGSFDGHGGSGVAVRGSLGRLLLDALGLVVRE